MTLLLFCGLEDQKPSGKQFFNGSRNSSPGENQRRQRINQVEGKKGRREEGKDKELGGGRGEGGGRVCIFSTFQSFSKDCPFVTRAQLFHNERTAYTACIHGSRASA